MRGKRIIALALSVVATLGVIGSFSACEEEKTSSVIGKALENELRFYCSDSDIELFLNDYYSRSIRNGDDAIGGTRVGAGGTFQKLWETDSLVWYDSTQRGLGAYDAMSWVRSYVDNLPVDKYGYVFTEDKPMVINSESSPWQGMGWPFPSAMTNVGTSEHPSYGENFKTEEHGWTINGKAMGQSSGYGTFEYVGGKDEPAILQTTTTDENDYGYDTTLFGNFVEIEMILEDLSASGGLDGSNIEDWYLSWQTEESGDEWFSVSQKEWSVTPVEMSGHTYARTYFPMYMHEKWDKQHVKSLRIVIEPKEGESINIKGRINYLYMMADTRHSTNVGNFISTMERYVMFNNDIEFLKKNITKARRAMQFQLGALQGEKGILDLSWFRGHSLAVNDGQSDGNDWYYGYISVNGFWDIFPTGHKNAEANYYFYMSLLSLIKMERYLEQAGIRVDEPAVVANPELGKEDLVYSETADSLEALAKTVRENICKDVKNGGFWNPETGRFAWAVYDADNEFTGTKKGEAMDYGHIELNLRMICEGIATEAQAKSIMSWISGERTVQGDDSTGKDIYFYEFAPRVTTKENLSDYTIIWLNGETKISNRWAFGKNCQSGGAIMFITYYDLITRLQTRGANDAYTRLKEITKWYSDVSAVAGASQGISFYSNYYNRKKIEAGLQGLSAQIYTLQGNEQEGNGALGLNSEFLESALPIAAIPYGFFGIETGVYNTLTIAPNLPSAISYFGMSNLMYAGVPYDCVITKDTVEISNVEGNTDGLYIKVKIKKPNGSYTVRVNGKKTPNYSVVGDYVEVTVPFKACTVTVK